MSEESFLLGLGSAEAAEAFWRGLFDIHLDPLAFLDVNYRIVRANHAMAEALGCPPKALVGRHCYEVFHSDNCPVHSCPHSRLMRDGCAHAEEIDIPSLGGIHWISVTPVFDTEGGLFGSLHIARNVSRYKTLEAELRVARDSMAARAEARARELGQHISFEQLLVSLALDCGHAKSDGDLRHLMQIGVCDIAKTGGYDRCVFWQITARTAQVVARYEREKNVRSPLEEVTTAELTPWLFPVEESSGFSEPLSGGGERCVAFLQASQAEGVSFALQVEYRPEEQPDSLQITPERLRLFCQVFGHALWRHANQFEMQRLRDELTRLDRLARLSQLTAMLAHELNQPLAATLCNAQAAVRLLAQSPLDIGEVRSALDDIVENARHAGAVVQRTRALFKGDHQPVKKIELHTLVDRVLTLLGNEVALAGVVVERRIDESLPPVWGDEVQLQQVLLNLLGNAIDAVREEPKEKRNIAVYAEADSEAGLLRLNVQDSGVGLVAGLEEAVFAPFHTTKQEGMGMGLTICRQIVESLGGTIHAERVPTGGTVFRVTLPLLREFRGQKVS